MNDALDKQDREKQYETIKTIKEVHDKLHRDNIPHIDEQFERCIFAALFPSTVVIKKLNEKVTNQWNN